MQLLCECGNKILSNERKHKHCKPCSYKYRIRPKGLKYKIVKNNPTSFKKGHIPWSKGKQIGNKMRHYKGDNVGYDALHEWIERHYGKPKICENCGSTRNVQWANKTEKYKRDISDWFRLCKKCHCRYDFINFGKRKAFYI